MSIFTKKEKIDMEINWIDCKACGFRVGSCISCEKYKYKKGGEKNQWQ